MQSPRQPLGSAEKKDLVASASVGCIFLAPESRAAVHVCHTQYLRGRETWQLLDM